MRPYYEDGLVQLFHGDCREVLPELGTFDPVVITDPPYGDTSLEWDAWPSGWVRAISLTGAAQIWSFGSMRMWLAHAQEFADQGWKLGQDLVWEKHNGSGFHADRFKRVHETIVHWYRGAWGELALTPVLTHDATKRTMRRKQRPPHMGETDGVAYATEDGGPRLERSVIYARSMQGSAVHPTQKPEAIVRPLAQYSSAGVILDPFVGSGTTLRVARELGRRAVGIEANERYCEIAALRMGQEVLDFGGVA